MKYEIITLQDKQIIGMSREIAFNKGPEECPKFWNEYVEKIVASEKKYEFRKTLCKNSIRKIY